MCEEPTIHLTDDEFQKLITDVVENVWGARSGKSLPEFIHTAYGLVAEAMVRRERPPRRRRIDLLSGEYQAIVTTSEGPLVLLQLVETAYPGAVLRSSVVSTDEVATLEDAAQELMKEELDWLHTIGLPPVKARWSGVASLPPEGTPVWAAYGNENQGMVAYGLAKVDSEGTWRFLNIIHGWMDLIPGYNGEDFSVLQWSYASLPGNHDISEIKDYTPHE